MRNFNEDTRVKIPATVQFLRLGLSLIHILLKMTAAKGEAYTFSYMRKKLLRHRYRDYHVVNGKLVLD